MGEDMVYKRKIAKQKLKYCVPKHPSQQELMFCTCSPDLLDWGIHQNLNILIVLPVLLPEIHFES